MFGGMKRSAFLLAALLSACAPTTATVAPLSLGAGVPPVPERITVKDKATVPFLPDVLYNSVTDIGMNMRVSDEWNLFRRVSYEQNYTVAWQATSLKGTGQVGTAVKITGSASGYTQLEFTTSANLPEDAIHAFHDLLLREVKKRS